MNFKKELTARKNILSVQLVAGLIGLALFSFGAARLRDALLGSFIFTNVIFIFVSLLLFRQMRRPDWQDLGFWNRMGRLAPIVLSGTLAGTVVGILIFGLLRRVGFIYLLRRETPGLFVFNIIIAGIWSVLEAGFYSLKQSIERKVRENEELKHLQVRTELQVLQAKLNPHFLFNTLNTMINLVHGPPDKLESMILNLSDVYRNILDFSERESVPLREELALVREYLEIEKARLGDRFSFSIEGDASLDNIQVPPLILEPVVENAVLHGIQPKPAGGKVLVNISHKTHALVISVRDDGVGFRPEESAAGFGLRSIRERLKYRYGDKARLKIGPAEGGGTQVELEIRDGA